MGHVGGFDRILGARTSDLYREYCEWSAEVKGEPPLSRKTLVGCLGRSCGLTSAPRYDRRTKSYSRFIVDDRARQKREASAKRSPEERLSWDGYYRASRQRIEAFLEHPKDTWEGWTYPEMYEVYVQTLGSSGMVPLPYGQFAHVFSLMWADRGGRTVPVYRKGRTVRVLRGPVRPS